jgi:diphthamide biosynthesis protein 3
MGSDDEGSFHDEVEIEDFTYDEETESFTYPCPCGDMFTITKDELLKGEDVAECPSCSLIVKVVYNKDEIEDIIKERTKAKNKNQPQTVKAT